MIAIKTLGVGTKHPDHSYLAACVPAAESVSKNFTAVPLCTIPASSSASQFVKRMQPCDSVLPILSGSGVPWMRRRVRKDRSKPDRPGCSVQV